MFALPPRVAPYFNKPANTSNSMAAEKATNNSATDVRITAARRYATLRTIGILEVFFVDLNV